MRCPRSVFSTPIIAATFVLLVFGFSESRAERFSIYRSSEGAVKGWSHIVTNPENFPLVSLENAKYAVDERSLASEGKDLDKPVFRTVLVRKMSNWGQQHANGIEPVFSETPLRVGDLESVTIRLKLNAKDSKIPDAAELREHYSGHLSSEEIQALDKGVPCLGLTFVEAGYNDQSTETLNAVYSLEFDPSRDFDRWLEITIPLADFTFGFEKDYSLREVDRSTVLEHEFVGFRINPETTGGGVARSFIGEKWDGSVPELYKELSVSLEFVEAKLEKGGE